ncbi:hypothetical protein [Gulosibacter bifidus]|uniref:Uncharacterized protein n=1 Tax=Gulosibacter bifidus TaxID=272239 RepID=A0ABW5RIB6_9MICO|nr:hypothetical protein [Gulosibacter bifidus]
MPRALAIDGRSGAGKSRLAERIAQTLEPVMTVRILHMDLFYPGWDGLDAGARAAADTLETLSQGNEARLQAWDWHANEFRNGGVVLPSEVLIIEGCGAISRASVPYLTASVWLDAPADLREPRATARDGDDRWWPGWAAQEAEFYARECSRQLAMLRVDAAVPEAIDVAGLCGWLREQGWPGSVS